jgi:hypothetical protein
MNLPLDEHDKALVAKVAAMMDQAIASAHEPVLVTKGIVSQAMRRRNKGRTRAIREHPFQGICEVHGLPLAKELSCLDEIDPGRGFEKGNVRWVCPKANNSGLYSCGAADQ